MALYIPHSIFHLAWLLYVRPETFGPYYVVGSKVKVPVHATSFLPRNLQRKQLVTRYLNLRLRCYMCKRNRIGYFLLTQCTLAQTKVKPDGINRLEFYKVIYFDFSWFDGVQYYTIRSKPTL